MINDPQSLLYSFSYLKLYEWNTILGIEQTQVTKYLKLDNFKVQILLLIKIKRQKDRNRICLEKFSFNRIVFIESFEISWIETRWNLFNPFHATDLFWYPLKTSENQGVSKEISGKQNLYFYLVICGLEEKLKLAHTILLTTITPLQGNIHTPLPYFACNWQHKNLVTVIHFVRIAPDTKHIQRSILKFIKHLRWRILQK